MKSSFKRKGRLATVLLVATAGFLASCGSDHDNSPAPAGPPSGSGAPPAGAPSASDNAIPATAGGSVAAYIAYLRGLRTDETSTPVSIGSFVAPVDETGPPTSLGS